MTRRGARGAAAALLVVAAALGPVSSAGGTAAPTGAAPPRSQVSQPVVPPPGVELSPEVAAVPASSPELDRAEAERDALVADRADAEQELAGTRDALGRDGAERTAVASTASRRAAQVDKAAAVAERSRVALAGLTVDRFVEGDHLLEGLDPALTMERREELSRQLVLGRVGADRLIEERRHTSARLDQLTRERNQLRDRVTELDGRIADEQRRIGELEATLAELGPQIESAERAVRDARSAAAIDGTDMSALALDAYWRAAQFVAATDPSCGVSWSVLAGIGRTESRHGTYRGATLGPDGVVAPPIYGPELDGSNAFAVVPDSDGGRLDATARTDRAVGPMQFLPGTWRTVGTDLTGDGTADPQNLFDAAAAAAVYLCRSGPGLQDVGRRRAAVLTYNRSQEYADLVEQRSREYAAAVPLG